MEGNSGRFDTNKIPRRGRSNRSHNIVMERNQCFHKPDVKVSYRPIFHSWRCEDTFNSADDLRTQLLLLWPFQITNRDEHQ